MSREHFKALSCFSSVSTLQHSPWTRVKIYPYLEVCGKILPDNHSFDIELSTPRFDAPYGHFSISFVLSSISPIFLFTHSSISVFPPPRSPSHTYALPLSLQLNEKREKSHHCEGAHMHYCHHKGAIIWVSSALRCIRKNSCSIIRSLSAKQMTHSSPLRFTPTVISSILRKFTEESDEMSYLMFCKVHLRLICLHWKYNLRDYKWYTWRLCDTLKGMTSFDGYNKIFNVWIHKKDLINFTEAHISELLHVK